MVYGMVGAVGAVTWWDVAAPYPIGARNHPIVGTSGYSRNPDTRRRVGQPVIRLWNRRPRRVPLTVDAWLAALAAGTDTHYCPPCDRRVVPLWTIGLDTLTAYHLDGATRHDVYPTADSDRDMIYI